MDSIKQFSIKCFGGLGLMIFFWGMMILVFLMTYGCNFSPGNRSGDNTTGDSTTANGPANVTITEVDAGGDVGVNNQPDNSRNPDNLGINSAELDGLCFIELYKPDSENGTASVLFSENCPGFSEVCMFRRPLNQIPPGVDPGPREPVSEQGEADGFDAFEEECGMFTSRQEGVAKWAFELPGRFYSGAIVAKVAGQAVTFTVEDPAERQEDVSRNDLQGE